MFRQQPHSAKVRSPNAHWSTSTSTQRTRHHFRWIILALRDPAFVLPSVKYCMRVSIAIEYCRVPRRIFQSGIRGPVASIINLVLRHFNFIQSSPANRTNTLQQSVGFLTATCPKRRILSHLRKNTYSCGA